MVVARTQPKPWEPRDTGLALGALSRGQEHRPYLEGDTGPSRGQGHKPCFQGAVEGQDGGKMALPTPTNSHVLIKRWEEAGTCRRGWKHLFLWVWGVVQVGGTCEQRQAGRWDPEDGGQSPGPPLHQVPLTHHSLTRTHSGKRLHEGGSGLAARPLGAIQAPGAEAFWGNCRSVERFGVLHGEVGGPAGQARRVAGGSTGSLPGEQVQSPRVLFAWLLWVAGSSPWPNHWSGFRGWGVGRDGMENQGSQRQMSQRVGWILGLICCLLPLPAMPT